ncbi:MAG TPA: NUDIX hydrolase [Thermoanaerobaculia bacterium]|nr:NUDIX hydrolase [Thermoanaerobaculia bacterium]
MRPWELARAEALFSHRLLHLERHHLRRPGGEREALVVRTADWVNVIPLLADGRVLLVRQWRFGIAAPTLEIPGGMVEGEDDQAAAERELVEETGYHARTWRRLGELHPNPAIQGNRITTWLATDLERVGEAEGDGEEEIGVESAPLVEIPSLIARGEITHSLVVAAFYLLGLETSR